MKPEHAFNCSIHIKREAEMPMTYINKILAIKQYDKDCRKDEIDRKQASFNPNLIDEQRMEYMKHEDDFEAVSYSHMLNG